MSFGDIVATTNNLQTYSLDTHKFPTPPPMPRSSFRVPSSMASPSSAASSASNNTKCLPLYPLNPPVSVFPPRISPPKPTKFPCFRALYGVRPQKTVAFRGYLSARFSGLSQKKRYFYPLSILHPKTMFCPSSS